MPYAGRKPKEDRTQIRHRNPVHEFREIPDVPFDGPKLPRRKVFVDGVEQVGKWPSATLAWWDDVRRMPHAKDWAPGDWQFGFATAAVHARTCEKGLGFTELRQREDKMGTTLDARNGMRIRYVTPSTATKREEAGEVEPVASNVVPLNVREMYG